MHNRQYYLKIFARDFWVMQQSLRSWDLNGMLVKISLSNMRLLVNCLFHRRTTSFNKFERISEIQLQNLVIRENLSKIWLQSLTNTHPWLHHSHQGCLSVFEGTFSLQFQKISHTRCRSPRQSVLYSRLPDKPRISYLFRSTVVTLNTTPFSQRIMKSLCEKGQFPMLSPSLPACGREPAVNEKVGLCHRLCSAHSTERSLNEDRLSNKSWGLLPVQFTPLTLPKA